MNSHKTLSSLCKTGLAALVLLPIASVAEEGDTLWIKLVAKF